MRSQHDAKQRHLIRAWLLDVLKRLNKKATPVAQEAGVSPSTLTRALDEKNPSGLGTEAIGKIVHKFNVPPPDIFQIGGAQVAPGFGEAETLQLAPGGDYPAFLEPATPDQSVWEIRTGDLVLAGYMPGDKVQLDQSVKPEPGDLVYANVYNLDTGTADTVPRIYQPPYIVVASMNYRIKPLLVDGERVLIMGTVVLSGRTRSRS